MNAAQQEIIESVRARVASGEVDPAHRNVCMIRMERVRLLKNGLPAAVRAELRAAVKRGELVHMKKDGLKPECYFHPNFDYMAKEARGKHEADSIAAIMRCGAITRTHDADCY